MHNLERSEALEGPATGPEHEAESPGALLDFVRRSTFDYAQTRHHAHRSMPERFHGGHDGRILKNCEHAVECKLCGSVLAPALGVIDEHRLCCSHRSHNGINRICHTCLFSPHAASSTANTPPAHVGGWLF
jgi:hypothetical protein